MVDRGPRVSEVRFTAAHTGARDQGLVGFLSWVVDGGLRLDGIALRRTREGRLTLSFPERRDSAGRGHPYIRPVDDASRRDLEAQVLASLGLSSGDAP